jgi:hypothetical protein
VISIKPITDFYTADDEAVLANKAELKAMAKRRQSELVEIDALITSHVDPNPNAETRVQNLIAGIDTDFPKPLDVQRTDIQMAIRDIEQALDFLADKERQVNQRAGARLAKGIKPQVDIAERELVEALVIAHEKHLTYFNAKRHLINGGTGLNGLFASNVDDVLGIPVDKGTALADLFRAAVRDGYLRSIPKELKLQ